MSTLPPDPLNNRVTPPKKVKARSSGASKGDASKASVGVAPLDNVRVPFGHDSSLLQGESCPGKLSSKASITTQDPHDIDSIVEGMLLPAVTKNGVFKLKNKMFHLGYSYHIQDAPKYINYWKETLGKQGHKMEHYSVVKEFGKSKGETCEPYAHTHVALSFHKPITITNPRFFDYRENDSLTKEQIHPHIKRIHLSNWDYICTVYHKKDGVPYTNYTNEIGGKIPVITPSLEAVEKCTTEREVVELAAKTGNIFKAGPLIKAWEHVKPVPKNEPVTPPEKYHPWQQEILNEAFLDIQDDRTIIWYVDKAGDSGKTLMSTILESDYNGIVLTTPDENGAIYAVRQYIDTNQSDPHYIIYNLSRQTTEAQLGYICNALEKFKDGVFTSTKYDSKPIRLKRNPQVIVFSNSPPDSNTLSQDRWDIRVIGPEGTEVTHRFHGYSASVRHELYLQEEKALNLKDSSFPITKDVNPGRIYDISFFKTGFSLIAEAQRLFYMGKIAEVRLKMEPITNDMINRGVPDNDYNYRQLTLDELKKGYIYRGELEITDMTPEQLESMRALSKDDSVKKEKFLKRLKDLNRGKLLSELTSHP